MPRATPLINRPRLFCKASPAVATPWPSRWPPCLQTGRSRAPPSARRKPRTLSGNPLTSFRQSLIRSPDPEPPRQTAVVPCPHNPADVFEDHVPNGVCLPAMRQPVVEVAWPLLRMRQLEHLRRGAGPGAARPYGQVHGPVRQLRRPGPGAQGGSVRSGQPSAPGHPGAEPGAGRRHRTGLAGPGRRRPGHRQIHPAAAAQSRCRADIRAVLYVSGEESVQQLKLRAERLGIGGDRLLVLAENDLDAIVEQVTQIRPTLAVIDSIQTVFMESVSSAPGSVSQVRECAGRLMLLAKSTQVPVFLVGHVNKEGAIAGPRVLEHIVDTVLYLEGERHQSFRILRSQKNRFGSTDELGIFEMLDSGMREVLDPSRAFLEDRSLQEVGNVVHVALEGTRPLLVELQSLVTDAAYGTPRRSVTGIDLNRLHMLAAVLEKRAGVSLGGRDIFVNVAGGVKLTEPAADLATALAIASNANNQPAGRDVVAH